MKNTFVPTTVRNGVKRIPLGLVLAVTAILPCLDATASPAPVDLGSSSNFAVLAASTVTSTGGTIVDGNLGLSPGTAVVGFPPGTVTNGTIHATDAPAAQAQSDLTIAYNDAAGRTTPTTVAAGLLGGLTLTPGLYKHPGSPTSLGLTGTLTLDAQGDPNAVWIFQSDSTVIAEVNSSVVLTNGAQACNVFWQVGSSATLRTGVIFKGTIMALASVTLETGATLDGRVLARNGAITLDNNIIRAPDRRRRCRGTI